jgi:hypothetical protein
MSTNNLDSLYDVEINRLIPASASLAAHWDSFGTAAEIIGLAALVQLESAYISTENLNRLEGNLALAYTADNPPPVAIRLKELLDKQYAARVAKEVDDRAAKRAKEAITNK